MTQQEVFDKAYNHFVTEKGLPSICEDTDQDNNLVCKYKLYPDDPDSPRCAVGLFIEDYNKELESEYIALLVADEIIPKLESTKYPLAFWASLQRCHDFATNHADFHTYIEANLYCFANKYDLQHEPLSQGAELLAPDSHLIL